MKTKISLKLNSKEQFFSDYNEERLARSISAYLMEECYGEPINNDIEITIYHGFKLKDTEEEEMKKSIQMNFEAKIKDEEYYCNLEKAKEAMMFTLGIVILILYYIILKNVTLLSGIALILGWLAIWESTYSFLFDRLARLSKIKRLSKLASAKVVFQKIK